MPQLSRLLLQAEHAMGEGRWEAAQQLYEQALNLDSNNPRADQGLRNAHRAVVKEADLEASIAEADEKFAAGDYQGAVHLYMGIMEYAADEPCILKYHTHLEERRNRAKELQSWSERVAQTLRQARQQGERGGDWSAASQVVDEMLKQLPQAPDYQPLIDTLEAFRSQALRQEDDVALYNKALSMLRAKEYEKGIECLEYIARGSQKYEEAQRTLQQANQYLRRQEQDLAPVEKAIDDGRWSDALALLDDLRSRLEAIPSWRRLYLRAGTAYGRTLLEEGRQLNQKRNFEQARRRFEEAQTVFQKVLDIFPSHLEAQPLHDEAADLAAIAGYEAEAQKGEDHGRREEALQAYKLAQQRVERARTEGRDYAAVGIMVETLRSKVEAEQQRIREEAHQLRDAESLWENNQLSEARKRFHQTLDALLPEHQEQAAEGLRRVEEKLQRFEGLLERAQQAPHPSAAVQAYEDAHALWAAGPGLAGAFEQALLAACETALQAEREVDVATYARRGTALYPDNPRWQRYLEVAGLKPELEAILHKVQGEFQVLSRGAELGAEKLESLLAELEAADVKLARAGEAPALEELQHRLHDLQQQVDVLQCVTHNYIVPVKQHGDGSTRITGDGNVVGDSSRSITTNKPPELSALHNLRLDVAVPEKVCFRRTFEIAVSVRFPTSPKLTLDDLKLVQSGDLQVDWSEEVPRLRLRICVSAPECDIHGDNEQLFCLYKGFDSTLYYFELTPKKLGKISVIVRVYQETNTLGSARIRTTVYQEKEVGSVHIKINSHSLQIPQGTPIILGDYVARDKHASDVSGSVVSGNFSGATAVGGGEAVDQRDAQGPLYKPQAEVDQTFNEKGEPKNE
jgi:hypothetical protein